MLVWRYYLNLANDTEQTIAKAHCLWQAVGRENLLLEFLLLKRKFMLSSNCLARQLLDK